MNISNHQMVQYQKKRKTAKELTAKINKISKSNFLKRIFPSLESDPSSIDGVVSILTKIVPWQQKILPKVGCFVGVTWGPLS